MAKTKNKTHRFYVYEKCNYTCMHCGLRFIAPDDWDKKAAIFNYGMFLEIDHIVPLSIGGSDDIQNKQSLCQKCNNKKSNKYVG